MPNYQIKPQRRKPNPFAVSTETSMMANNSSTLQASFRDTYEAQDVPSPLPSNKPMNLI